MNASYTGALLEAPIPMMGEHQAIGFRGVLAFMGLLGIAGYTYFINYRSLEERRQLETEVQSIVRNAHNRSVKEVESEILQAAQYLGVPLEENRLNVEMSRDDYGNPVLEITITYPFEVDLLLTKLSTQLPISEKLTLLQF